MEHTIWRKFPSVLGGEKFAALELSRRVSHEMVVVLCWAVHTVWTNFYLSRTTALRIYVCGKMKNFAASTQERLFPFIFFGELILWFFSFHVVAFFRLLEVLTKIAMRRRQQNNITFLRVFWCWLAKSLKWRVKLWKNYDKKLVNVELFNHFSRILFPDSPQRKILLKLSISTFTLLFKSANPTCLNTLITLIAHDIDQLQQLTLVFFMLCANVLTW